MMRARRTPSIGGTPSSESTGTPSPPWRSDLPETVQQATSGSGRNGGPRRRKRKPARSSQLLWSFRRWAFPSSRGRGRGLELNKKSSSTSSSLFPILGCLAIVMTSLLGIYYAVFLRHGTAPILRSQIFSKSTARSRKVSVLAAKDFSVVFHKPSLDRRHTMFHMPHSHELVAEDKDFGGLEIRFVEDLDQRQKGRFIYHDFQNDWGVAKLKSGPNDGTLYAVGCNQKTFYILLCALGSSWSGAILYDGARCYCYPHLLHPLFFLQTTKPISITPLTTMRSAILSTLGTTTKFKKKRSVEERVGTATCPLIATMCTSLTLKRTFAVAIPNFSGKCGLIVGCK